MAWQVDLPGDEGQSSPVIWGDRIFLTSSDKRGAERLVYCLSRKNGELLWKHTVWKGDPEDTHKMNGWASSSCTTDGNMVYAFFGKGGLHAFTVEGKPAWSKDLGSFEGPWGTAACPIIVGNLLIQNCDADVNARMIAFDKTTGKEVWTADRHEYRGWSTPLLLDVQGKNGQAHQELVINGHTGARGYDPKSGKELWSAEVGRGRGTPTVTPDADGKNVFVIPGRSPGVLYSVGLGGTGKVNDSHLNWVKNRGGGRDLSSPVVIGDYVMAITMNGILFCNDAKTGEELWKARIGGNFSASPVAWRGHAFFVSETGETVVIKPGKSANIVSRNVVPTTREEIVRASLTPTRGQVFLRSTKVLYCIDTEK